MYKIIVKRKVLRRIQRLPEPVQRRVANLVEDLRDKGPIRSDWPHYSKLGSDQYHCHLFPRLGGLLVLRENFKNH